jgi:MerR family mercuric resistance operon transcriptional regulator
MINHPTEYSRGSLASETGVNIETIRYYERIGLMPDPARSPGGHRVYVHSHVKRLFFIRRSRELGFTLREVGELLELVDRGSYTCDQIRDRAVAHLAEVAEKIRDLQKMQGTLSELISKCKGDQAPECAIVDTLFASKSSGRRA